MRSIAVMNQKGGVGKTTTAVNLAWALAARGKKTLLIDMDPQAHASLHLGWEPDEDICSIYDVLVNDRALSEAMRAVEESPNLWIVPAHLDLAAAEVELAGVVGREFILRDKIIELKEFLHKKGDEEGFPRDFDYLLVDCPPSLGVLTINSLTTVEEIFIPLQPHYLALHGLGKLLETVSLVSRRLNQSLRVSGVLFCLYDTAVRLSAEVSGDVTEFFRHAQQGKVPWNEARVFQTRIRKNVRLAEAPSYGKSIFLYDEKSNGAQDYAALAEEVLKMENGGNL
ncbi:MAG: AAA family ATPase [Planctomycetia bacterium]|nr:AAA family ATPase [Planctomycetia bacterium]